MRSFLFIGLFWSSAFAYTSDWKNDANKIYEKYRNYITSKKTCDLAVFYEYPETERAWNVWSPKGVGCFKFLVTGKGMNAREGCTFVSYNPNMDAYSPSAGGGFIDNEKCTKSNVEKLFRMGFASSSITQDTGNFKSKFIYASSNDLKELWQIEFDKNTKAKKEQREQLEKQQTEKQVIEQAKEKEHNLIKSKKKKKSEALYE